tara:strand:+ start:832 stop:975 length:144 start_codon:yes stop_codon:yes gene_type:complete
VNYASTVGEKMRDFGSNKITIHNDDPATYRHPKSRQETDPSHIDREA